VLQYLERHAEPEAGVARAIEGRYASAFVVPVRAEASDFWRAYAPACKSCLGRVLGIFVVNQPADASEAERAANRELLAEFSATASGGAQVSSSPPIWLHTMPILDILVVDRSSMGYRLPSKQGVGLARKIGADIALALWQQENVEADGFGCTDADVSLPAGYFEAAEGAIRGAGAALFPFVHLASGEVSLDEATWQYEWSLRYYVQGLAHAGSGYAYHTVGSTLFINAHAYAQARGFPKRLAGEDFYLLDKLAKLGPIVRLSGPTIGVAARRSSRVPFGTGPAVERLLAQRSQIRVYSPRCFLALKHCLDALTRLCDHRSMDTLLRDLNSFERHAPALVSYMRGIDFERQITLALHQASTCEKLQHRLHIWFDGKKTLRLIHAMRDAGFGEVAWQQALEEAPFVPPGSSLAEALCALRDLQLSPETPAGA
jgi:hypothetical protein